jgi:hypothetical protein
VQRSLLQASSAAGARTESIENRARTESIENRARTESRENTENAESRETIGIVQRASPTPTPARRDEKALGHSRVEYQI